MRTLVEGSLSGDYAPELAAYKLTDSESRTAQLLTEDKDLKWVRRETCSCGSTNTCQILDRDRFGLPFHIMLCEDCGLVYFAETLDESSIVKYYNEYFLPLTNYQGDTLDKRGVFCQYKFIEPHIIARYSGNDLVILDVGAGTGQTLMSFEKNFSRIGIGTNLFAYEPNEFYWQRYRRKGIKVLKSPTDQSKFYDLIILSHVLEHVIDPIGYLKQLRKLLSPSGIIYIEVPGILNTHNFRGFLYDIQAACPHFHVQLFNATSLTNVANLAGFEPIEVTEAVRGAFYRVDQQYICGTRLSSNAQRIQTYLKYLKEKKDKWGRGEFWFDVYGRQPIPQTRVPIHMRILRKIKRRIAGTVKSFMSVPSKRISSCQCKSGLGKG